MQAMVPTQNIRTPVSQVPGIGKKDAIYLHSMYRFRDGNPVGQYNVFNTIQGNVGQGFVAALTPRETSIVSNPGQVPLDQRWECWDIGVEFVSGGTETDGVTDEAPVSNVAAADAYSKLQLALQRGQTQLIQLGPVGLFAGGGGVYSGADDASVTLCNNGFPSIGARRRLGRSLVLNPGDTWTMAFIIANADQDPLEIGTNAVLDVRVSMWIYRDLGLSG